MQERFNSITPKLQAGRYPVGTLLDTSMCLYVPRIIDILGSLTNVLCLSVMLIMGRQSTHHFSNRQCHSLRCLRFVLDVSLVICHCLVCHLINHLADGAWSDLHWTTAVQAFAWSSISCRICRVRQKIAISQNAISREFTIRLRRAENSFHQLCISLTPISSARRWSVTVAKVISYGRPLFQGFTVDFAKAANSFVSPDWNFKVNIFCSSLTYQCCQQRLWLWSFLYVNCQN